LKGKKIIKTGSKRGSKSGMLPSSYQSLTDDERDQVNVAFLAYNQSHPQYPFLIVDQFYHQVYRKGNWLA
jgi:hypothetical protein